MASVLKKILMFFSCVHIHVYLLCRYNGQAAIYFPPKILLLRLWPRLVYLCTPGRERQMRNIFGVLNRYKRWGSARSLLFAILIKPIVR